MNELRDALNFKPQNKEEVMKAFEELKTVVKSAATDPREAARNLQQVQHQLIHCSCEQLKALPAFVESLCAYRRCLCVFCSCSGVMVGTTRSS
jgi:hypothetical protein